MSNYGQHEANNNSIECPLSTPMDTAQGALTELQLGYGKTKGGHLGHALAYRLVNEVGSVILIVNCRYEGGLGARQACPVQSVEPGVQLHLPATTPIIVTTQS